MGVCKRGLKSFVASAAMSLLFLGSNVRAAVVFDWALIGDPGNTADSSAHAGGAGQGAVANSYYISKTKVTNAQYVEFLNAKDPTGANTLALYNTHMSSLAAIAGIDYTPGAADGSKYTVKVNQGNKPVVYVTWYDSARFANWLHNGQGAGDTESGAYTLLGGTPTPSNESSIARTANATVFLPSESEWYKAAYYKGGGTNAGYWTYATQSDTLPTSQAPAGGANSANYHGAGGYALTGTNIFNASQNYLTDVGAYINSVSAYGTFDQTGNTREWNETLTFGFRGLRGGDWNDDSLLLPSSSRGNGPPSSDDQTVGFRVAATPEPAGMSIVMLGGIALLKRRRRL